MGTTGDITRDIARRRSWQASTKLCWDEFHHILFIICVFLLHSFWTFFLFPQFCSYCFSIFISSLILFCFLIPFCLLPSPSDFHFKFYFPSLHLVSITHSYYFSSLYPLKIIFLYFSRIIVIFLSYNILYSLSTFTDICPRNSYLLQMHAWNWRPVC